MGQKIVVTSGPGYSFALETYQNQMFVHCDMTENKPSVLKEMLRRWKDFREVITIDLFALHLDSRNTPAHRHFLKKFGFELQKTVLAKNGVDSVEIWINKGK